MTVAFPSDLPRPQRAGYGYELTTPMEMAPNDRGLARPRRIATANQLRMVLSWIFTTAQLATFAGWWRNTAAYGTTPFTLALVNGYIDASQEVRAIGPYKVSEAGGRWAVSMPVELVAMPVASQAEMQTAIDNYTDLSQADALHFIVHSTLPEQLP